MAAPVCSSWVYINQSVARRSATKPLGDQQNPGVQLANVMVGRVLLIQWVFAARGCWFNIEQPLGSIMEHHPLFQRFVAILRLYRHNTAMGSFGLAAWKPTWIYSSHSFICEIEKYRETCLPEASAEMTRKRLNALGRLVVDGGCDLKSSQAYTHRFGWAMAQVYVEHKSQLKAAAAEQHRRARKRAAKQRLRFLSKDEIFADKQESEWLTGACLGQVL